MFRTLQINNLAIEISEDGIFFKLKDKENKCDISRSPLEHLKEQLGKCLNNGTPITKLEINDCYIIYNIKG